MRQALRSSAGLALAFFFTTALSQSVAYIPSQDTYLLPPSFSSNASQSWTQSTKTSNVSLNNVINAAQNASVVVYDDRFESIVGTSPQLQLAAQGPPGFAAEGGVWAWDRNEVWFASSVVNSNASRLSVLNLTDNTVVSVNTTGAPIPNPNGGYYFNRTVYFTTAGNQMYAGGVVAINPADKSTITVVNSYFGLRFNFPDDIAWVRQGGNSYMFFTDFGANNKIYPAVSNNPLPQIENAVWRFDPQQKTLKPVISRADIAIPNGVRVNAEGTKLYIGDTASGAVTGFANSSWGSAAVFEFDLDANTMPVNKRMFSLARTSFADGMHLDDAGNVWTAEGDGIWVRSPEGTPLGVINVAPLIAPGEPPLANFALAGDVLVVLAQSKIWTLKLPRMVVAPDNLS